MPVRTTSIFLGNGRHNIKRPVIEPFKPLFERRLRLSPSRLLKTILLCGLAGGVMWCLTSSRPSRASTSAAVAPAPRIANVDDGDYVGSEACKDCHEDQFK